MIKGICHVVGAGDFSPELLKLGEGDIVIACDGGYKKLKDAGLPCNICVGDFDSLGYVPDHSNTIVLPRVKDVTDMEEGIRLGVEKGFSEICIYGALGGERFSHSVANMQTISGYAQKGIRCTIKDKRCDITALCNEKKEFDAEGYSYVSAFAMSDKAIVSLVGFKYGEGEELELSPSFPLGVSNEFKEKKGSVSVKGNIIIIFEKN